MLEYRRLLVRTNDDDHKLLIERTDEFARKYPQYADLMPVRASIYKLNEMEGLQRSIWLQQMEIGAMEQDELQKHLEKEALRSANLAAEQLGFGSSFYTVDAAVIRATVGAAWANGKSFSESIWDNREKLAAYLNDDFGKNLARGVTYEECTRQLADRFLNVSKRDAYRLVYTEGTFVLNEARAQVHEQDFDHYALSCADGRACPLCKDVEAQQRAKPARFEDRAPGLNFPPLHPMCRCSYTVEDDMDDWLEKRTGKVFERSIYDMTTEEVMGESIKYDKIMRKQWQKYLKGKKSGRYGSDEAAYANTVGMFVESMSGNGSMTPDFKAKPEGKELQLASWIAQKGHDVRFVYASNTPGSRTPDYLIDGELWEAKRVTSLSKSKIKERISDASKKCDSIIIDLSVNKISKKDFEDSVLVILKDRHIRRIMAIQDGDAIVYE